MRSNLTVVKLCSVWEKLFESTNEKIAVDVYHWTGRAALDVIGITGFGWDFSAIKHEVVCTQV